MLAALAVGLAGWLATRPGPLKAAYDRLPLGVPAADAERLIAGRPVPAADHGHDDGVPTLTDWQGQVDGEPFHVVLHGEQNPAGHPVLAKSLFFRLMDHPHQDETADGSLLYTDGRTGRVIATLRQWQGRGERLLVLYDAEGRLAQKVYGQFSSEAGGWDLRDFIVDSLGL